MIEGEEGKKKGRKEGGRVFEKVEFLPGWFESVPPRHTLFDSFERQNEVSAVEIKEKAEAGAGAG